MKAAPPYLFVDGDCVRAGPWTIDLGEGPRPLPTILPTWDYATELSLNREIDVPRERVIREAGLDETTTLAVGVLWRSTASELRGPATMVALTGDGRPLRLSATLPGRNLGGNPRARNGPNDPSRRLRDASCRVTRRQRAVVRQHEMSTSRRRTDVSH